MSNGGFEKKSPLEVFRKNVRRRFLGKKCPLQVFRKNVHWRCLEKMYAEGF
jgi:hypothetical protein